MHRLLSADELEEKLFGKLLECFPDVTGHVFEIHKNRWWGLHVYMTGGREKEEKFLEVVRTTTRILPELWPEPPCYHKGSRGRDGGGRHFFTVWLAVPPEKSYRDFAGFFPNGRRF